MRCLSTLLMVVSAGMPSIPRLLSFPQFSAQLGHRSPQPSPKVIRLLVCAPGTLCANFCPTPYHIILHFHAPVYVSPFPDSEHPEGKNHLMCPPSQTLARFLARGWGSALNKRWGLGSTFSFSDFCLRVFFFPIYHILWKCDIKSECWKINSSGGVEPNMIKTFSICPLWHFRKCLYSEVKYHLSSSQTAAGRQKLLFAWQSGADKGFFLKHLFVPRNVNSYHFSD